MKLPQFLQIHRNDDAVLAHEAAEGLRATRAHVSPKFFYDALGSRLFDAITELPEYYPTRTEAAILAQNRETLSAAVIHATGPAPVMVDLGAGSCAKAARLFSALRPRCYVAVDISVDYLRDTLTQLQREHAATAMVGVGLDFSARLQLPDALVDGPALVFYPGSSIGNFAPDEALRLLREARETAAGGALLIGVDLVKPTPVLNAAYDDELGVTAAFNLNLLRHLNALLGADFRVRDWAHQAWFDEEASRIEMHLQARRALSVTWPGGGRVFAMGERIHTENSHKWRLPDFEALLRRAGFDAVQSWTDERGWFAVCLATG